jgi:hypothetical protein
MGEFWSASEWKMLIYLIAIWNILLRFGKFYGHLVNFAFVWYIFPGFGYHAPRKIWQPWCGIIVAFFRGNFPTKVTYSESGCPDYFVKKSPKM